MVRKFMMWKTNKGAESEDFPPYVIHITDFSPNRKTPMSRDLRVSSSQEQIQKLWNELKEENIKKGWELHSAAVPVAATPALEPVAPVAEEPEKAPAKKPKAPRKKAPPEEAPTKPPKRKKKPG